MSEIEDKLYRNKHAHLTIDELHVLYTKEILALDIYEEDVLNFTSYTDSDWDCAGYLEELRLDRKEEGEQQMKEDYARIYGCRIDQVTTNSEELYDEEKSIVVFIGSVFLESPEQKLPKTLRNISGCLFSENEEEEIPQNLDYIGGSVGFLKIHTVGPKLPNYVSRIVDLRNLREIPTEGLGFPEYVGGHLKMLNLKKIPPEGVVLPKTIGGDLMIDSLRSVYGVLFPEYVLGAVSLASLESIGEDQLPEYIGRDLILGCLKSIDEVQFPEYVGGGVYLNNISRNERNKLRKQRPDLTILPTP
ncbi:MAG: hypothetical protein HOI24_02020 [Candidatus Magasanikbacteria bacterium]|nr:hypothetical protein [Candidatus Magasanikbacteria bacterium]